MLRPLPVKSVKNLDRTSKSGIVSHALHHFRNLCFLNSPYSKGD